MSIRDFLVKLTGGPTNVKLSLARVYLEVGDRYAACKLLQEVALEGTEEERKVAKGLLVRAS